MTEPHVPSAGGTPRRILQDEVDRIVAEVERAYADAYSRGDAPALAAIFTEDATVEAEWGAVLQGRAAIEEGFAAALGSRLQGERLETTPTVSSAICADVIVSHGVSVRGRRGFVMERFFHTRVLLLHGDRWLLAADHTARPSPRPAPVSGAGPWTSDDWRAWTRSG
jgi:uncharacterized protein (TIGR02246 family)